MAGFNWFWKAMGGQQSRNQKRSRAIVDKARTINRELDALDDAQLVARARDLASGDL